MVVILVTVVTIYFAGVYVCNSYNKELKNKGLAGIDSRECWNPLKQLSVFFGFLFFLIVPEHIIEQYVYRLYHPVCKSKCYDSPDGTCYHCGCKARAKAMSPYEGCSANHWGPIVFSKRKYYDRKKKYPFEITVKDL